ncbi:MAG TPA: hypothetical protein VLL52_03050 [Anaerolineae bacterium]|nr:hypothetical protein [Anaerolineae bacterium]
MSEETVYKAQVEGKEPNPLAMGLITLGLFWLIVRFFHIDLMSWLWPAFTIILPGAILLWPARRSTADKRHGLSFLAMPGGFLVAVGSVMLFLNGINHMEGISYMWPLFFVGGIKGWNYARRFDKDDVNLPSRERWVKRLVYLTGMLTLFFELFVFQSLPLWVPLLIIGYGIYLWRSEA